VPCLQFPNDPAFYVHRSGRTGRAGKSGVSLLLYMPEDRTKIHSLTKEIGAPFQRFEPLKPTATKVSSTKQTRKADWPHCVFCFPSSWSFLSFAPLYQFLLLLMRCDKMAWWQDDDSSFVFAL